MNDSATVIPLEDKAIHDLTVNDILQLSRRDKLSDAVLAHGRDLLVQMDQAMKDGKLSTVEKVAHQRLRSLVGAITSDNDDMSSPTPATGKRQKSMGAVLEDQDNEAKQDKSAILVHFDNLVFTGNVRKLRNLDALEKDVQKNRLRNPLLVRDIGGGKYEVIGGHRRGEIARRLYKKDPLNFSFWPCKKAVIEDKHVHINKIKDNYYRDDYSPTEEAQNFSDCKDLYGWTQAEIAQEFGVSERHVSDRLALLQVSEPIRALIDDGLIAPNNAFVTQLVKAVRSKSSPEVVSQIEDVITGFAKGKQKTDEGQGSGSAERGGQSATSKPSKTAKQASPSRDAIVNLPKRVALDLVSVLDEVSRRYRIANDGTSVTAKDRRKDITDYLVIRSGIIKDYFKKKK